MEAPHTNTKLTQAYRMGIHTLVFPDAHTSVPETLVFSDDHVLLFVFVCFHVVLRYERGLQVIRDGGTSNCCATHDY